MPVLQHNPGQLFPPYRCYSHATEIRGDARILIISGLNGYLADGTTMPESFEDQAELIWTHIQTLLRSANMELHHLVSLRTYLAHPMYDEPNVRMRVKFLGDHRPCSTVICCQLLDPRWKLEVEAMAAADAAA
jgi:2-iminobutanoate/2-iminopropanoate deaminase